jgi:hypothetical protein
MALRHQLHASHAHRPRLLHLPLERASIVKLETMPCRNQTPKRSIQMTRASKMNMLPKPKTKTTRRLSKADIQRESLNLPPLYSVRSTLWIILLVQASVFALHVHTIYPKWHMGGSCSPHFPPFKLFTSSCLKCRPHSGELGIDLTHRGHFGEESKTIK